MYTLTDTSLFVRRAHHSVIILLVYVDDILVTGNDSKFIEQLIQLLAHNFEMQHLGLMNHFLGLEIKKQSNGLVFSHENYAYSILRKARMLNCKKCATPMAIKKDIVSSVDAKFIDQSFYRSIVGAL